MCACSTIPNWLLSFESTDMNWLKKSQIAFLTQALGGPAHYKGQDMRSAHAGLGYHS